MKPAQWFDIAAIATAVAVSVGVAVGSSSVGQARCAATSSNPARRPRPTADHRPLALFIGDSCTAATTRQSCTMAAEPPSRSIGMCALYQGGDGQHSGGPAVGRVDPHSAGRWRPERIPHFAARYDPTSFSSTAAGRYLPPREDAYATSVDHRRGPAHVAAGTDRVRSPAVSR